MDDIGSTADPDSADDLVRVKQRWRARLLTRRRDHSSEELARARMEIVRHVVDRLDQTALENRIECVAGYEPLRTEPGSRELLSALRARTGLVLVPVTRPDRDLDWARWEPGGRGDPLGASAIGTAGLVLVPALAVARNGTRLGRGGGSYDRALRRCAAGVVVAAVVFDEEVFDALPAEPWDVPVVAAVTPSGWIALG